jgi:hypothetical protein
MSFKKLSVVVDAGTGVATGTPVDNTMSQSAIDIIALPFGVNAADTEYVQKSFAATATLAWGVASTLVAEAWGNKRGRNGQKSIAPLFRA